MLNLERKDAKFRGVHGVACSLDIKSLVTDGEFEGYAATFGNVDNGGDVMVKGCFMGSLRTRPASAVKMLWQHCTDELIGKWLEIREDDRGLYVRGQLFTTLKKGAEAYLLMKEGQLDGLSIGFRSKKDEWDNVNNVRRLIDVDLREVSLVTFPMNELAGVSSIKSISDAIDTIESLSDAERILREASYPFSRKEATEFVSVVKKIARREAGDDQSVKSALHALAQMMRN